LTYLVEEEITILSQRMSIKKLLNFFLDLLSLFSYKAVMSRQGHDTTKYENKYLLGRPRILFS
jgi:hypothetical protein